MEIRWYVWLFVIALGLAVVSFTGLLPNAEHATSDAATSASAQQEAAVAEAPDASTEVPPIEEDVSAQQSQTSEQPSEPTSEVPSEEAVQPEIVAYINQHPVSAGEFEDAKSSILSQYNQAYAQFGMSIASLLTGAQGRLTELSIEADAMYRVFGTTLIEMEAEARGLAPTDEAVQEELDLQLAQLLEAQGWTEEELKSYLAAQGTSYEDFLDQGWKSVAWQLTLDAVMDAIAGPIEPSQDELQAYFDEHLTDYSTEEEIDVSQILFGTSDSDLAAYLGDHQADYEVDGEVPDLEQVRDQLAAAIQADAEAAYSKLQDGKTFEELSAMNLDGGTSSDLGWTSRGMMGDAFDEAAFALEVGDVSELVETDYGFHIIYVSDRKDAYTPELADVIDQVRTDLVEETRTARTKAWMEEAYEAADVEILLPLIDAVWTQQDDLDTTIEKLEHLVDEGLPDEPYLGYILASMYEIKRDDAIQEKEALESGTEDAADATETIAELEDQIAAYTDRAAAGYRLSLDAAGEDSAIQAKLDALLEPTEGETRTASESE